MNRSINNLIIVLSMLIMYAYGVTVGSFIGNYGYISVLMTGIVVFIWLIFRENQNG